MSSLGGPRHGSSASVTVTIERHVAAASRIRVGVPCTPPGVIERGRLISRLARQTSLTVLRAPSGFGKTVAVCQWLASPAGPDGPAVWVRVDAGLEPATLWIELADLLREAGVPVPPGGRLTSRTITTTLRRLTTPVAIVIDGFDELSDSRVEDQLIDLVRYCRNVHLIVCLRSSRHFPSSLRVDIDTTVIESPELAFTAEEIGTLEPAAPGPPADWAAEVRRHTGGWPEPTRAVLLALQDDPHQSVDDAAMTVAREYLSTRVLPRFHQDAWLKFAFVISLPEVLGDDVARHISGDERAPQRLERLESAGILTADHARGRRIYRWPDAAREAMREEFARRDAEGLPGLHRRLAWWYLHDGDARSAVAHALRAHDTALLVQIVEEHWGSLLHNDLAALDEALAAIPTEAILASPRATAARDIRMHVLGDVTDAALVTMPDPLPADERALKSLANSPAAHAVLHTAYSMMIATRMRGLAQHALDYAGRSEVVGRHAIARRPGDVGALWPSALLQIGITRMIFDDLPGAEATLRVAYQVSAGPGETFVRRDAAGKLALLHAISGDATRAEAWLRRHDDADATPGLLTPTIERSAVLARALVAIDRLQPDELAPLLPLIDQEFTEEQGWRPFLEYVHARRCLIWSDRRGALQLLDSRMQNLAPWLDARSTMGPLLTAVRIDLLLSLGWGGPARSVLEASQPHPALQPAAARLALLTAPDRSLRPTPRRPAASRRRAPLARSSLTTDDSAAQIAMADDASHTAGQRSELLLVAAIARHRQGDTVGATESLNEALHTTQATGSLLPFAMVPRDELRRVASAVPDLMAVLDREPLRSQASPFSPAVALVELTEWEHRVLNRIADDGTLQEIAGELFVSYNTIKSQVRSLYTKLGANSRSEALTNAARHGLLAGPVTDRN